MSQIVFKTTHPLQRASDLTRPVHLEALVGVPAAEHPVAEHFRICGVGHHTEEDADQALERMNAAASRVEIVRKPGGCAVVVDGRYTAGDFDFKQDYSDAAAGELRVAECAIGSAIALSEGAQPSDLALRVLANDK